MHNPHNLIRVKDLNLRHLEGSWKDGIAPHGTTAYRDVATGMIFPRMAGGARGMIDTQDLLRTLDQVPFDIIWTDFQDVLRMYNEATSTLLGRLARRISTPGFRTFVPGSMRFERGTEYGRPDRQRHGAFKTRGFPVWKFQLGITYTRDYLLNATREEVDIQHAEALRADTENVLNETLRAAFHNTNYNFEDDRVGTVSVKAFYNNDGEVPPPFRGTFFAGTHTHYHSTNGAWALAHITAMKDDLVEHGHDGNRILEISTDIEADIRALTDANGDVAFHRNWNIEGARGLEMGGGSTETVSRLSPEFIGEIEGFAVRVNPWQPAKYAFGYNFYGEGSANAPLGFREPENEAQRGLNLISPDAASSYPLINSFYERWFGVAVMTRSNGTITVEDAGAAYINPTASIPGAD